MSTAAAQQRVGEYTDPAHLKDKSPYAYPAYDELDTGSGANQLNDGDLLACTLLNVRLSTSAFYRFRDMRPDLEAALSATPDAPLVNLDDESVSAKTRSLYAVLDADRSAHGARGQSGTTLSKILHRKRPESLPLHDKWVRECYLGTEAVPRVRRRSWADYMVLVTLAMKQDLARHQEEIDPTSGRGPRRHTPDGPATPRHPRVDQQGRRLTSASRNGDVRGLAHAAQPWNSTAKPSDTSSPACSTSPAPRQSAIAPSRRC